MTRPEFHECLDRIRELHPTFKPTDAQAETWYRLLGQMTPFQFCACLDRITATIRFTPTISEFIKARNELFGDRRKKAEATPPELLRDYRRGQRAHGLAEYRYSCAESAPGRIMTHFVQAEAVEETGTTYCARTGDSVPMYAKKIDFVLDRLGAQVVADELRSIVPDLSWSGLCRGSGWVVRYKAKLDELVERARNLNGRKV